VNLLAFQKTQV